MQNVNPFAENDGGPIEATQAAQAAAETVATGLSNSAPAVTAATAPVAPAGTAAPIFLASGAPPTAPVGGLAGLPWPADEATLFAGRSGHVATIGLLPYYFGTARPTLVRKEIPEFRRRQSVISKVIKAQSAPVIVEAHRPYNVQERTAGRAEWREKALAELLRLKASGFYDTAELQISESTDRFIRRAIGFSGGLLGILVDVRKRMAEYSIDFFNAFPRLFVSDRIDEIRAEFQSAGTLAPDKIAALQDELVRLESSSAGAISEALNHRLITTYHDIRQDLAIATGITKFAVESFKEEVEDMEREFFRMHGVPHEVTGASKQYDAVIRRLDVIVIQQNQPHALQPSRAVHPQHSPLNNLFGVEVVPGWF